MLTHSLYFYSEWYCVTRALYKPAFFSNIILLCYIGMLLINNLIIDNYACMKGSVCKLSSFGQRPEKTQDGFYST